MGISFDNEGVCNYCRQIERLKEQYLDANTANNRLLLKLIDQVKKKGKGKPFDCVVGVSGGTDSSYVLMKAIEWGLRPLAVHYDNTWNSAVASQNIYTITRNLNVPLRTYVVDNQEVDDIKRSFLLAGVREFDADTDIAFVQVIRQAAAKHGIRYIFEGHSFLTEGLTPVNANYLDGGYVQDIHRRFGSLPSRTFPNMTFFQFLKWILVYRQKFVRPLWYLVYDKAAARKELHEKLGWAYYGGHHLENYSSNFAHTVWLPRKFGIDYRILTLAADVREGKLDRGIAIKSINLPITPQRALLSYALERLKLTEVEFDALIRGVTRNWSDFKTYKRRFERLRPLFFIFAKLELVPMSFYLKYCKKIPR